MSNDDKEKGIDIKPTVEVPDSLKNFISFSEDGYASLNQKLPDELRVDYKTFINNYYTDDNNKVVNNIVDKIRELPDNTVTTIAELINYNSESAFVDPLVQGIIRSAVDKKCRHFKIELQRADDSFTGLAYHYRFKKTKRWSIL